VNNDSLVQEWVAVIQRLGDEPFSKFHPSRYQKAKKTEKASAVLHKSGRRPVTGLFTRTTMTALSSGGLSAWDLRAIGLPFRPIAYFPRATRMDCVERNDQLEGEDAQQVRDALARTDKLHGTFGQSVCPLVRLTVFRGPVE
jgi:hypothetical protein